MLIHDICSNKQYTFASICHFWYLRSVASIVHGTTSSSIYAPIGKVYTSFKWNIRIILLVCAGPTELNKYIIITDRITASVTYIKSIP
jgi:hypothetical protein